MPSGVSKHAAAINCSIDRTRVVATDLSPCLCSEGRDRIDASRCPRGNEHGGDRNADDNGGADGVDGRTERTAHARHQSGLIQIARANGL